MSKTLGVVGRIHNPISETDRYSLKLVDGQWQMFCNGQLVSTFEDNFKDSLMSVSAGFNGTKIYMDGKLIYPK